MLIVDHVLCTCIIMSHPSSAVFWNHLTVVQKKIQIGSFSFILFLLQRQNVYQDTDHNLLLLFLRDISLKISNGTVRPNIVGRFAPK